MHLPIQFQYGELCIRIGIEDLLQFWNRVCLPNCPFIFCLFEICNVQKKSKKKVKSQKMFCVFNRITPVLAVSKTPTAYDDYKNIELPILMNFGEKQVLQDFVTRLLDWWTLPIQFIFDQEPKRQCLLKELADFFVEHRNEFFFPLNRFLFFTFFFLVLKYSWPKCYCLQVLFFFFKKNIYCYWKM